MSEAMNIDGATTVGSADFVVGMSQALEGAETLIGSNAVEDTLNPSPEVVEDAKPNEKNKADADPEPQYMLPEVVAERLEDFVSEVGSRDVVQSESLDFVVTARVGVERRLLSDGAMSREEAHKLCESVKKTPGVEGLYIVVEALDEVNRELYGL